MMNNHHSPRMKIFLVFLIFFCTATSAASAAYSIDLQAYPDSTYPDHDVTFIATVTDSGNPVTSGSVHFLCQGTYPAGNCFSSGYADLNESGQAAITRWLYNYGTYDVRATISPNNIDIYSDASCHVNRFPISITVSSDKNPTPMGDQPTFTATVSSLEYPNSVSEGQVQFMIDGSPIGPLKDVYDGQATLSPSDYSPDLEPPSHQITAQYIENNRFEGKISDPVTQVIQKNPTQVNLEDGSDPSAYNHNFYITAYIWGPYGVRSDRGYMGEVLLKVYDGSNWNTIEYQEVHDSQPRFEITDTSIIRHPGTYRFKAEYSGNDYTAGNTSDEIEHTVSKQYTSTSVESSLNPSTLGDPVTFNTTVTKWGPDSLTGSVQYWIDEAPAATVSLTSIDAAHSYAAYGPVSSLTAGNHNVTAIYLGNDYYDVSQDILYYCEDWDCNDGQLVNKAVTSISVVSGSPTITFGDPVTFTATVSSVYSGSMPTGIVTFTVGSQTLGTGTLSGTSPYTASCTTTHMPTGGSQTVTATYSGDTVFSTSQGTTSQTVNKAVTTTTLVSNKTTTVYGETVRFTATVTALPGIPTGTVTFVDGTQPLGSAALNSTGGTYLDVSSLSVGTHTINATYTGDTNYTTSFQTLSQTVNPAATTTSLLSNKTPTVFGEPIRFTATIHPLAPGTGIPSGSVIFNDGTNTLGTVALNGTGGTYLDVSSLSVGTHTINATYTGDKNFTASWMTVTQAVNQAATTTEVTSSQNPIGYGVALTLNATVSAVSPGAGTPTGTVTFRDGSTTLGTVNLVGAKATLPISAGALAVGSHSLTAVYSGDTSFIANTSPALILVVNPPPRVGSFGPPFGARGATVKIGITGIDFQGSVAAKLTKSGAPDIPVTGIQSTATTISGYIAIPSNTPTGSWGLVVTNPDGGSVVRANALTMR